MDLSGALVATRKAPVRRNGIVKRGDAYFMRKRIKGHLYQIPLHVENAKDARKVYDQVLGATGQLPPILPPVAPG